MKSIIETIEERLIEYYKGSTRLIEKIYVTVEEFQMLKKELLARQRLPAKPQPPIKREKHISRFWSCEKEIEYDTQSHLYTYQIAKYKKDCAKQEELYNKVMSAKELEINTFCGAVKVMPEPKGEEGND